MKTGGHHRIAEEAGIPRLKKALKDLGITNIKDKDILAFSLGNWLTDVSQFIDPRGFIVNSFLNVGQLIPLAIEKAEEIILEQTRAALAEIDESEREPYEKYEQVIKNEAKFIKEITREYFYNLSIAALKNFLLFIVDLIRFKAYVKFVHHDAGSNEQKLDYKIFAKIFDNFFTQYLPNEHLDRPECRYSDENYCTYSAEVKRKNPNTLYANSEKKEFGMYEYLYDDIKITAGKLSQLDKEWASIFFSKEKSNLASDEWQLGLAKLGHTLHTVEDFFAHSNFIELASLRLGDNFLKKIAYDQNVLRKFSGSEKPSFSDYVSIKLSESNINRVFKRLKKFKPDVDTKNSKDIEDENLVVTGYFDGIDTFISILYMLWGDLFEFEEEYRTDLKKNIYLDLVLSLLEDFYQPLIEIKEKNQKINRAEHFFTAIEEYQLVLLQDEYTEKIKNYCPNLFLEKFKIYERVAVIGIISYLRNLFFNNQRIFITTFYLYLLIKKFYDLKETIRQIRQGKAIKKLMLDLAMDIAKNIGVRSLKYFFITYFHSKVLKNAIFEAIGNTRIGCHSLLAKDDADEIFYEEGIVLAKTIHWIIVDALCRYTNENWQENNNNRENSYIDWLDLLSFFLRHPALYNALPTKIENEVVISSIRNITLEFSLSAKAIYEKFVSDKNIFSYKYFLVLNELPLESKGYYNSKRYFATRTGLYIYKYNSIKIPYNQKISVDSLWEGTWYEYILSIKDITIWEDFLTKYSEKKFQESYPPNQFYQYKLINLDELNKLIKEAASIASNLKSRYNGDRDLIVKTYRSSRLDSKCK